MGEGVGYLGFCFSRPDSCYVSAICVLMFLYSTVCRLFLVGGLPACGGGRGFLPLFMVSSGGFPARVASVIRFGVFYMPGELCPALLFGSIIVLEGVV